MDNKKIEDYRKKITINKEIIKNLKKTKTKEELNTILLRFQ
tara:strand:- start:378 stop:500 length:123 start_codon:yes stop_codon:yes gene_type:complete